MARVFSEEGRVSRHLQRGGGEALQTEVAKPPGGMGDGHQDRKRDSRVQNKVEIDLNGITQ